MEEQLDQLHKIISKAGYPICLALSTHKLKRSNLLETREFLIRALDLIEQIISTLHT